MVYPCISVSVYQHIYTLLNRSKLAISCLALVLLTKT